MNKSKRIYERKKRNGKRRRESRKKKRSKRSRPISYFIRKSQIESTDPHSMAREKVLKRKAMWTMI